jgi:hypothetical protein
LRPRKTAQALERLPERLGERPVSADPMMARREAQIKSGTAFL